MKFWKYNLNSQLNFFHDNHNNDDLHFILINNKRILAYNVLKKEFSQKYINQKNVKKIFFLFDSFLVAKNYRNQNLGSKHLKENKIYLKKAGKPRSYYVKKVNKFLCKK